MSETASSLQLQHRSLTVGNNAIELVLQSLALGVHILFLPVGMHMLLKHGYKSKTKVLLLLAIVAPFLLSSVYWALQLADLLISISSLALSNKNAPELDKYRTLFESIILLNCLIADAIVVWRAWVLCREDFRRLLSVPLFCLILTALSIITAIGLKTAIFITNFEQDVRQRQILNKWLDDFQLMSTVFSFLTNFTSTSIVGLRIWRFRKSFKADLRFAPNRSTAVEQILVFLIEAGLLYCVGTALTLAFILIKLPSATLGDICTPMSITVSGVYPTIVIALVSLQRSTNCATWQTMDPKTAGPSTTAFTTRIASVQLVQVDRISDIALGHSSVMEE